MKKRTISYPDKGRTIRGSQNPRIMEVEGAYEAIKSKPLLKGLN